MADGQGVEQNGEHWLTYAELGRALGISVEAARSLARRHRWHRQIPNDYGVPTRVLVPADRLVDRVDDRPLDRPMTALDPGLIEDRPEADQGTTDTLVTATDKEVDSPVDTQVDPGIAAMFGTMQSILDLMREELTAAKDRANRLQAELDWQIAQHREQLSAERTRADTLMEELAEQRRITAMLVEQLSRRRWWHWRRR